MTVVAWIVEGTWPACVDAARIYTAADEDLVLLHVADVEPSGVARGAFAGLLGRHHPEHDPGRLLADLGTAAAADLLGAAVARAGRECRTLARSGRPEREVVAACDGADLLILARDGDRTRLGPHSLGPHTRFVVDHAPCPVLLVWPGSAPDLDTIPPPPD